MDKIAVVNGVANEDRSTGRMVCALFNHLKNSGYTTYLCYGHGPKIKKENVYRINSMIEYYFHALMCRIFGWQGHYSYFATKRLIRFLKERQIDTVYAISLHAYYLNEKLFLDYIAKNNINFIYIMTEQYPYFAKCGYNNGCQYFLSGCGNCPQVHEYPKSWFFDRTKEIYQMKKEAYGKLQNSIFVGPLYTVNASKESPLMNGITTYVLDESIDMDLFFPKDRSKLMSELNIPQNTFICVCVAPMSYERKGCRYFVDLARRFEDDNRYIFVHIGYDIEDKSMLPSNYMAFGYEKDQERLAEFFSLGDLFVFPSLLDTMPLACLEALACGTPILGFNVSGMPFIADEKTGTFVDVGNINMMEEIVRNSSKKDDETISYCREYALSRYDSKKYNCRLESIGKRDI